MLQMFPAGEETLRENCCSLLSHGTAQNLADVFPAYDSHDYRVVLPGQLS